MKLLILLLAISLFSCNNGKSDTERATFLVDSLNQAHRADSIAIDAKMRLDAAKATLGKGDTLSDSERLKKAREAFK